MAAGVVCLTSPDLVLPRASSSAVARARRGRAGSSTLLFPAARPAPLVTVLDGHPHTLSFLGAVNGVPVAGLGVDQFGQSGDLDEPTASTGSTSGRSSARRWTCSASPGPRDDSPGHRGQGPNFAATGASYATEMVAPR